MPLRVALNVAYAMLAEGLDEKQRQTLDEQIYGWGDLNERGMRDLRAGIDDAEGGGEG